MENGSLWMELFRLMVRVRHFEQTAFELYTAGKLPGFLHLSIGQEATSVGACAALRPDDYMASTHRGHGDTIAKGVSVQAAMTELFGGASGACHAKGGSMHIADFSRGILGANGIIAAGVPITVGAALSIKQRRTDQVALCFFGDGATGCGPLHEGMNMAMLWKLPMIFVRQNNHYAESTPRHEYQGIPDVVRWAEGYGMPAVKVDGNDVLAVYEAVSRAAVRARRGEGPSFIDSETYRWYGHNIGDPGTWRPKEEVETWKARDPIARFRRVIIEHNVAAGADLDAVDAEEAQRMKQAAVQAENEPKPPVAAALEDLYSDPVLGAQAIQGVRC
ncbi:MAG: thiamine pyrophosphate-dependent dehydrogenase E1 component subunit alpha [Anaerolineae bacterium]|nr:thiamine pyrophosphate-dependent dehydrogenase E1 component subunit alpha [Anaerolineae bacterium]